MFSLSVGGGIIMWSDQRRGGEARPPLKMRRGELEAGEGHEGLAHLRSVFGG